MNSPLRVLHLGKYYPPAPGGIEILVRDMAVAQVESGMDVSVFVFQHRNDAPTQREVDLGVKVTRFARGANFAKLDFSAELVESVRHAQADLIHLHVPNPSMVLAMLRARKLLGTRPIVVTYHSDIVRQKLRAALFRPLDRWLYHYVDAVCPTSPMYAGGSKFLRPYVDKIVPIPMGLSLEKFLAPSSSDLLQAERFRAECDGPLWLACGRLVYYKGFTTAIAALARTTTGGQLWIIGTGPDRLKLEEEAARMGVTDRVKFLGHVPRTVPYYYAADAFWFPSNARSESFGLAQVEAMASGCPVINTNIPHSGVPWVSLHEETGLTVPVGDPEALAIAADQLARHPELRRRYGEAARRRAIDQFEIGAMVHRLNDLYDDVLRGAGLRSRLESVPGPSPLLIS